MYGKIFESMYDGSLYGNWQALVTFQQMIVLCDRAGVIDMTPQALAARTSIPLDVILSGIAVLEAPDKYSRTPDQDGRRIERLDDHRPWGWRIVNHAKYKNMVRRSDKQEADRQRIAEKRQADKRNQQQGDIIPVVATICDSARQTPECRNVSLGVADVAHADADADADADAIPPTGSPGFPSETPTNPPAAAPTAKTWLAYRRAYVGRYGVEPVRNAKVNGQLAKFIARLGAEPSPHVAAFYVAHNRGVYVSASHAVDLMLRDAEALHTAWQRGVQTTDADGRAADRTQTNANAFGPLIAEARAMEAIRGE